MQRRQSRSEESRCPPSQDAFERDEKRLLRAGRLGAQPYPLPQTERAAIADPYIVTSQVSGDLRGVADFCQQERGGTFAHRQPKLLKRTREPCAPSLQPGHPLLEPEARPRVGRRLPQRVCFALGSRAVCLFGEL